MEHRGEMSHKKSSGHYAGHEVEPPSLFGPKVRGKQPPFHSHSKRHHRKLSAKSQIPAGRKRSP